MIVYAVERLKESWAVAKWLEIFLSGFRELKFTVECDDDGVIRCLGTQLLSASHVCWAYKP